MLRRRIAVTAALALAVLGAASGCADEPTGTTDDQSTAATSPDASAASPSPSATEGTGAGQTIEIIIEDGAATPDGERIQVQVGEPITLQITSDTEEELHLHSTPEHEFEISPGTTTETFTIDRPGIVEAELHELGVTVFQLEVS